MGREAYNKEHMMPLPKKYLHDKLVLLLLSGNIFLGFLCAILIFLRLNIGQGGADYIVQYRSNLDISAFEHGGLTQILGFVVFALVIVIANTALSIRTYQVRRELSLAILASGVILLLLGIIVSNALMVLH
jgi:hypothetical protein